MRPSVRDTYSGPTCSAFDANIKLPSAKRIGLDAIASLSQWWTRSIFTIVLSVFIGVHLWLHRVFIASSFFSSQGGIIKVRVNE